MLLKIKSFFTSKPVVNIFFFILVFLSAISFVLAYYMFEERFNIFFLGNINADVRINVETPFYNIDKTAVYINGEQMKTGISKIKNTYLTYEYNNYPVYNIKLKAENIDEIKDVVITVGDKLHYYDNSEIKNFKKDYDGSYIFPHRELTLYKSSKYINHRGVLNEFAIKFLAVFYNTNYLMTPLFFALLALSVWFLNKDKINISFNLFKNNAILWILLLSILLRLAGNDYAFWSDEIYSATVAGNPNLPFSAVFSDPGNPPLFFIFARYWQMLFGANSSLLRLLPCIFSVLSIYVLYIFIKDNVSKNAAILTAFLFSVNVYSIMSAKEYRCYSLCALLTIAAAYLLFRIIKTDKKKDYILYTITAVLMANTYYFEILVLIGNYIYFLFQPVSKQAKIKLLVANLIAAVSFLPYFIMTSFNKALMNVSFNDLPKRSLLYMAETFIKYYNNGITTLLVIVLFLCAIKRFVFDKKDNVDKIYIYSMYSVLFLFASTYLISLIRPIIREYYYTVILSLMIISFSLIFFMKFKHKALKVLAVIILAVSPFFSMHYLDKERTVLINFQSTFEYLEADSPQFREKGLKIGAALHDYLGYAEFYKQNQKGDEIHFLYKFPPRAKDITELSLKSGADVIYTRVSFNSYFAIVEELSKYFDVSSIRTNKDVIVARLVRNGK